MDGLSPDLFDGERRESLPALRQSKKRKAQSTKLRAKERLRRDRSRRSRSTALRFVLCALRCLTGAGRRAGVVRRVARAAPL
jgi:hypothetical protein